MKQLYSNLFSLSVMTIVFSAMFSCSNEIVLKSKGEEAKLDFFIKAGTKNDALVMDGDGSFSSLAVYVYNTEDGKCEYVEMMPEFPSGPVQEYFFSVSISAKTKVIYAIANYNDPPNVFSTQLTAATTMQELEKLTLESGDFTSEGIVMIGKKEVVIDNEWVETEVPMERLASRIDVYIFKNRHIENSQVWIKKVEFDNQILNTNGQYRSPEMLENIRRTVRTVDISGDQELNTVPVTVSGIKPEDLRHSFYSYQNISPLAKPDKNINPYLRITVNMDGKEFTYTGYIESYTQPEGRFSLIRNKVYRVVAIIGGIGNSLILDTSVFPWNVTESELGHEVKDTDIEFDAWNNDSEALKGIVQYPYIDSEGVQNKTSFANYRFRLTAPPGAVWTATLTNGLDFAFGKGGTASGKNAVSQGISRDEPYEIKVGTLKPWEGKNRQTYMYITVDGSKLIINPVRSDGTRKFPGGSDTDILILQTEYQK